MSALLIKKYWKIAVSLALLVGLGFVIDFGDINKYFTEVNILCLLGVLVAQVLDRCFMAWKWAILVNCISGPIKVFDAIKLYFICAMFGLLVPLGGVGADIIRFLKLEEYGINKIKGLASIFVERFLGAIGTLLSVALAALLFLSIYTDSAYDAELKVLVVASGLFLIFSIWMFIYGKIPDFIMKHLLSKLRASEIIEALASYKRYFSRVIMVGLLSFVEQGFGVIAFFFAAKAVGLELNILTCMVIIPVAAALARLPISLWGLGVREGVEVALFVALESVDVTQVASASFLMTLIMFVAALPGLYWWFFDSSFAKTKRSIS